MEHEIDKKNIKKKDKNSALQKIKVGLLVASLLMFIYNTAQLNAVMNGQGSSQGAMVEQSHISLGAGSDVLPHGVPDIYGKELGVNYDDVSAANPQQADKTINKLGLLDQKLSVSGNDLKRYIAIASKISCEYCCGAESIITSDGKAACGCAHSFAMRGLAKYLLLYHGEEYTDEQVLEELGKWKTLFFPEKMIQKANVLKEKGIEFNYVNLASNKYRGIEEGAVTGSSSNGQVGGC